MELNNTLILNSLNEAEKVKDISEHWVKKHHPFLLFLPSDRNQWDVAEEQALQIMNLDLSKLLKMKFSVFWSQVKQIIVTFNSKRFCTIPLHCNR